MYSCSALDIPLAYESHNLDFVVNDGGRANWDGRSGRIKVFRAIYKASLKKIAYKVDGEFKCRSRRLAEEELHQSSVFRIIGLLSEPLSNISNN